MNKSNSSNDAMDKAYRIAQEMIKDRLIEKDPEAGKDLEDFNETDVIVVKGEYDRIEQVLSMSNTPFTAIHPDQLESVSMRPDQIIFVNCPGNVGPLAVRKLASFVSEGGFLFTTDWALKHILEEGFPGYMKYNQKATGDEVVRVEVLDTDDPFLKSILGPGDDPQWWLEGSSYPIQILNEGKVKILVKSKEIKDRYGESPVFVTFEHGEGKVYHMISHFYLQRSETRSERHEGSGASFLTEKGIPAFKRAKYMEMGIEDSTLAEVESAYTSSAMVEKIKFDKRQQMKKENKDD